MSSEVPQLGAGLGGVQFGSLSGFRGQEGWGRWTLGKVSEAEIRAERPLWVEGRLKLGLPVPRQTATISLNGETVAQLSNLQRPATYDLRLALRLKAGNNVVRLVTDKSNRGPSSVPFAPKDASDIALSVSTFELTAVQPFVEEAAGHLYNTAKLSTSAAYEAAAGPQVQFFAQLPAQQVLHYRLLSARDRQTFQIRLDGQPLLRTTVQERGTLLTGQLPLPSGDRLHTVSIAASGGAPRDDTLRDSVGSLEQYNGAFPFYIQELRLAPPPGPNWQKPLVGGLALLSVLLLAFWLFGRERRTAASGQRT